MKYLEYIETDGSKLLWQLTNANISTANDIVYFDFMPLSGTVHSDGFYAFAQGSLFVRTWNGGYQVDNLTYQVIFYGHSWSSGQGPVWNVNTKYECVFSDSNLVRNGTTINYGTTQSLFTGPIMVNGELDGTTVKRNPVGRYYRIALERNGSLVCDYRPVIDDNNNPCFYDEVSQTYLYHTGTGTPIAGPQIKVPTDLTIGNKTVDSVNIGGKDVVSIYDGATLLWERQVTPQPTPPSLSDCVCFEALDANTSIRLHASQDYSFFTVNLWYSTDGGTTFSKMDRLTPITLPNIGDKMYVYGSNVSLGQSNLNYVRFLIYDGDVSVSGDLTRLLNPNGLTALPDYAFVKTFSNNTHLADVSGLTIPVTTVGKSSLAGLFNGCSNITTAPALLATTLGEGCYEEMFYGCSSLNTITCMATDISATNCTRNWVSGVAANGTFIKTCYMTSWTTGVNGIPTGWTVLDNDICTVDCTNYSDMGYASYEDCDCAENGNSNGYHYVIHNYTSGCNGWTVTYDGSQDCDAINHQQAGLWFEWELSYSPPTTYQQYVDTMSSYGITVNGSYCQNAHYSVWLEAVQD